MAEMSEVLTTLGEPALTVEEVEEFFAMIDDDKSGTVDINEFVYFLVAELIKTQNTRNHFSALTQDPDSASGGSGRVAPEVPESTSLGDSHKSLLEGFAGMAAKDAAARLNELMPTGGSSALSSPTGTTAQANAGANASRNVGKSPSLQRVNWSGRNDVKPERPSMMMSPSMRQRSMSRARTVESGESGGGFVDMTT